MGANVERRLRRRRRWAPRVSLRRSRTIDRILDYVGAGDLPAGFRARWETMPLFVRGNVLRVGPPDGAIDVVLGPATRTRHPLLPLVEEAHIHCRIIPRDPVQGIAQRPGSRRMLGDIELDFTFTSARSFEENLVDFAAFVVGNPAPAVIVEPRATDVQPAGVEAGRGRELEAAGVRASSGRSETGASLELEIQRRRGHLASVIAWGDFETVQRLDEELRERLWEFESLLPSEAA